MDPLPSKPVTATSLGVFVVDDEPLVSDLLVEVLRLHGYAAQKFDNATDALEAIRSGSSPAALITDYQLGGKTGLELISALKVIKPSLATILISGSVDADLLNRSEVQPTRFIPKPFMPSELLEVLKDLIAEGRPA